METELLFLVVYTCCISLASGVQEFVTKPQNTAVIKGQTAVMKCAVSNREGPIQWAKDGLMLGYDRSIPGYSRYSIIGSNPQEFNLQIINVNLDDDAVYQCQVGPSPGGNDHLRAEAHLQVLVPPNMPQIIGHSNGTIVEVPFSQPLLQLTCVATNGRPSAVLKWFRNGEEVTDGVEYTVEPIENDKRENSRSVLSLSPRYPEDNNAMYACQAQNDALIAGPLQVMVKLSVLYPPGQPEIVGYKRNQAIRTNDTVQLECTSVGGNPLAQVVWFKNNVRIDSSFTTKDNKAVNDFTFVAQPSDNGAVYRCEAWNVVNADTPLSANRSLVVHFAPRSVTVSGPREAKIGESLTLTCVSTNSFPAAVITWIPRGTSIIQDASHTEVSPDGGYITKSTINVTLTHQQNNAMYTCEALNTELGVRVSDTVLVGVLYPPDPPQIYGYTEGQSIKVGTILKLTCRAIGGNPVATINWYKGTTLLEYRNTSIGNIASGEIDIPIKADDNGAMYKCTASNKATDVPLEAVKKLTVHFPPASVQITADPPQGREGQVLKLTCVSASSNPAAVLTWIHNNKQIPGVDKGMTDAEFGGKSSKNVLKLTPTAADHQAVYGCRATNLMIPQSEHDAITLDILFKPVFDPVLIPPVVNIMEGASQQINLTARSNPPNSTYSLSRAGVILSPGDVSSFTLEGGVLTVSGISRDDGGPFTVIAVNSQGTTNYNFTINVQYPAEVTPVTPKEAEAGSTVVLECSAQGNPMTPNMVSWQRDDFDMTRALQSYETGKGTLTIEELTKLDSGMFKCIGDNRIGTPAEAIVELIVKFQPEIDKSKELGKAASKTGVKGRLTCKAEGNPTVSFEWRKDGVTIIPDDVKYKKLQTVTNDIEYENILEVYDVQDSDYGTYLCVVTNEKGEDSFPIEFKPTTIPDPPYELTFVNATHNSITIKWRPNFNGGDPTRYYRVRFRPEGADIGYTQVDVPTPNATVFTIKGLALGTVYEISVMAYNFVGDGEYQVKFITATTSNLVPAGDEVQSAADTSEDAPVIIILIVCVVGIFLLALNIGLILFFVRRRKKRMENGSDTTSHTNTIELYGPTKETALYPMTPSEADRSYGTYDKNEDEYSDDYKSYEHERKPHKQSSDMDCLCIPGSKDKVANWKDNCCFDPGDEDLKRVFLPPPEYGEVTYSHNNIDSPTFDHRHPVHTELKQPYAYSDTDSIRKSPWQYEDPYQRNGINHRGKGTFDPDPDYSVSEREGSASGSVYEPNGRAVMVGDDTRPKSIAELSEQSSSRSLSRLGYKTPPPPPVRSSSKGAADVPPIPARNYGPQDSMPRYTPAPGSLTTFSNINVIANPSYEGPSALAPSRSQANPNYESSTALARSRSQPSPVDDMRGHLV